VARPLIIPFAEPVVGSSGETDHRVAADRDLIARSVLAQAAADHRGRRVRGGDPAVDRVPAVPGTVVDRPVIVDQQPVAYIAVVTEQRDYFMCTRVPPEGFRLIYRPRQRG
jgi:hypothetical protein